MVKELDDEQGWGISIAGDCARPTSDVRRRSQRGRLTARDAFEFEALEQRILLSADGMMAATDGGASASGGQADDEIRIEVSSDDLTDSAFGDSAESPFGGSGADAGSLFDFGSIEDQATVTENEPASINGAADGLDEDEPVVLAVTAVSFTGKGDGINWSDPANWDGGIVPEKGDFVSIGASTVRIGSTESVVVGSIDGTGTLELSGNLDVDGTSSLGTLLHSGSNSSTLGGAGNLTVTNYDFRHGRIAGSGTLTIPAGGSFVASTVFAKSLAESRVIENLGTMQIQAALNVAVGSSVRIDNQGAIDFQGSVFLGSSTTLSALVHNQKGATIVKSTGTGAGGLQANVRLVNDGEIEVRSGNFQIRSGQNDAITAPTGASVSAIVGENTYAGTVRANAGTTLEFFNGVHDFASTGAGFGAGTILVSQGRVFGQGTFTPDKLEFTNANGTFAAATAVLSTLEIKNGAKVDFSGNVSVGRLEFVNGTLGGGGTVTVSGSAHLGGTLSAINMVGSGKLVIADGVTAQVDGFGGKLLHDTFNLELRGTMNVTSRGGIGIQGDSSATFDIFGTYNVDANDLVQMGENKPLSGMVTIHPGGLFRTGSGTIWIRENIELINHGTFEAAGGNVTIYSGTNDALAIGSLHTGVFTVAKEATLTLPGGRHVFEKTSSFSGAGRVSVLTAVDLQGSYDLDDVRSDNNTADFRLTGDGNLGTLSHGTSNANAQLTIDGTATIQAFTAFGNNVTINGELRVAQTGSWNLSDITGTGQVTNLGTFNISGANLSGDLTIRNLGTMTIGGIGSFELAESSTIRFENAGTFVAGAWTSFALPASSSGVFINESAGTFRKNGIRDNDFSANFAFTNNGLIDVQQSSLIIANLTNILSPGNVLTGGRYHVIGGTLDLAGQAIGDNAATVLVSGTGSFPAIEAISVNLGTIQVQSGATLNFDNGIKNDGSLDIDATSTVSVPGDFLQLSNGKLVLEIDGASKEASAFSVSGEFLRDGALTLSVLNPSSIVAADSFPLGSYGTTTGSFATVNVPGIPAGAFAVGIEDGVIVFEVAEVSTAITLEIPNVVRISSDGIEGLILANPGDPIGRLVNPAVEFLGFDEFSVVGAFPDVLFNGTQIFVDGEALISELLSYLDLDGLVFDFDLVFDHVLTGGVPTNPVLDFDASSIGIGAIAGQLYPLLPSAIGETVIGAVEGAIDLATGVLEFGSELADVFLGQHFQLAGGVSTDNAIDFELLPSDISNDGLIGVLQAVGLLHDLFPELADTLISQIPLRKNGFAVNGFELPPAINWLFAQLVEVRGGSQNLDLELELGEIWTSSARVQFNADGAAILPDLDSPELDGVLTLTDIVNGEIDLMTGATDFSAGALQGTLGDFINVTAESVSGVDEVTVYAADVNYSPNAPASAELLALTSVAGTIPALERAGQVPTITLPSLVVNHDGSVEIDQAEIDFPNGYDDAMGLAGFIPLAIDRVLIDFVDPNNLDAFTATTDAIVRLDRFNSNIPFDASLKIDGEEVADGSIITFGLHVASLKSGIFGVDALPEAELGISNLTALGSTFTGVIRVGATVDGALRNITGETHEVDAFFEIVSGLGVGSILEMIGDASRDGTVNVLAFVGELLRETDQNDNNQVTFGFRLTFRDSDVTFNFNQLSIENLFIDLGVVTIAASNATVNGQGDTEFNTVVIDFPNYDGIDGTIERIVRTGGSIEIVNAVVDLDGDASIGGVALFGADDTTITLNLGLLDDDGIWILDSASANSITFSAGSGSLFSEGVGFGAAINNVDGSFDFATRAFSAAASNLTIEVGGIVDVVGTDVAVEWDPLEDDPFAPVVTVGAISIGIGPLRGREGEPFGTNIESGDDGPALVVRPNGFTLDTVFAFSALEIPDPVSGVTLVEVINGDVAVFIDYLAGPNPQAQGFVDFTADSATLLPDLPGASLLRVMDDFDSDRARGLEGSIQFGTGIVNLTARVVEFPIENALIISAVGDATGAGIAITIDPDDNELATLRNLSVELPALVNLPQELLSLDTLVLRRDGFSLEKSVTGIDWDIALPAIADAQPGASESEGTSVPLAARNSTPVYTGVPGDQELGALSEKYESKGVGTVSWGTGDPGGKSYGSWQLAGKLGNPEAFLNSTQGAPFLAEFGDITPINNVFRSSLGSGTNADGSTWDFVAAWKRVAGAQPVAFNDAQHAYIEATHYDPLVEYALSLGIDINARGRVLQDVFWSTAVQHGVASTPNGKGEIILNRAFAGQIEISAMSDDEIIRRIYAERGRTTGQTATELLSKKDANGNLVPDLDENGVQKSVSAPELANFSSSSASNQLGIGRRFYNEMNDALNALFDVVPTNGRPLAGSVVPRRSTSAEKTEFVRQGLEDLGYLSAGAAISTAAIRAFQTANSDVLGTADYGKINGVFGKNEERVMLLALGQGTLPNQPAGREGIDFVFDYNGALEFFNTAGLAKRQALEAAANRIEALFDSDIRIEINVQLVSVTLPAGASVTGTSPFASPEFSPFAGFLPTVAEHKIKTGSDANGGDYDAGLVVVFSAEDAFDYTTGSTDAGKFDFQGLVMRELLQIVGVQSGIEWFGADIEAREVGSAGVWSTYDQFLASGPAAQPLIDSTTYTLDVGRWIGASRGGSDGAGLYFAGPNAVAAHGSTPLGLYSPVINAGNPLGFVNGQTAVLLDADQSVFEYYLLSSEFQPGVTKQSLAAVERGILLDLGFDLVELVALPLPPGPVTEAPLVNRSGEPVDRLVSIQNGSIHLLLDVTYGQSADVSGFVSFSADGAAILPDMPAPTGLRIVDDNADDSIRALEGIVEFGTGIVEIVARKVEGGVADVVTLTAMGDGSGAGVAITIDPADNELATLRNVELDFPSIERLPDGLLRLDEVVIRRDGFSLERELTGINWDVPLPKGPDPAGEEADPLVLPVNGDYDATGLLGELSARFESNGDPGIVSTGEGDRGGRSYGLYQFASNFDMPELFLASTHGAAFAADFAGMDSSTSVFADKWRQVADRDPAAFGLAQHEFSYDYYFDHYVDKVLAETGLDVNARSRVLQDVIWSTAIQHGRDTNVVTRMMDLNGLTSAELIALPDHALVKLIYAERGRENPDGSLARFGGNSADVQAGVKRRFVSEMNDALNVLFDNTTRVLTGSVGSGGQNAAADVTYVQNALVQLGYLTATEVSADTALSRTFVAIADFQADRSQILGLPDGVLGSDSERELLLATGAGNYLGESAIPAPEPKPLPEPGTNPTVQFVFDYSKAPEFQSGASSSLYRDALEDAARRIAILFDHTAVIEVEVTSYSDTTTTTLASAGSNVATDVPGFNPLAVQQEMITGIDQNGAAFDGEMEINLGQPWDFDNDVASGSYDFKSTIMHELLHMIGFLSLVDEDGSDYNAGTAITDAGHWATFDKFLTNASGVEVIDPTSYVVRQAVWTAVSVGGASPAAGLFFAGANAMAANGGNRVGLYSPSPWESGSSGSHVDDDNPELSLLLMAAAVADGPAARELSDIERGILLDLGFTLVAPGELPDPAPEPEPEPEPDPRPRLLSVENGSVHFFLDVTLGENAAVDGFLTFSADSAAILPDAPGDTGLRIEDDNPADNLPALSGAIDFGSGRVDIDVRKLAGGVSGIIEVDAVGVSVTFDPKADAKDDVLSLENLVVAVPALERTGLAPPSAEISNFVINHDGSIELSQAIVEFPDGYNKALNIAGVVPAEIDRLVLDWPNPENIEDFLATVDLTVDLAPFNETFTTTLKVDGVDVSDGGTLSVSFWSPDLRNGNFRVAQMGEIELSVSGVQVGGGTFDGSITVGAIADGQVQPIGGGDTGAEATGIFTITGGGDIGASIQLTGDHTDLPDGGGLLTLTGTANLTVGQTTGEVRFTARFENGSASFAINEVSLQNIEIITPVIEIRSTEVSVNVDTGRTEATNLSIIFPTFNNLTGSAELLVLDGNLALLENASISIDGAFGIDGIIEFADSSISATLTFVDNGGWTLDTSAANTITFGAGSATIFGAEGGAFGMGLTDVEGTINPQTGELNATAEQLDANLANGLVTVDAQQIEIDWDPDETDESAAVVTVMAATLTVGRIRDEDGAPLTATIGGAGQPGLIVTREGFTIRDASVTINFNIEGILDVQDLVFTASSINYTRGSPASLAGTVTFSAASATVGGELTGATAADLSGSLNLANGAFSLTSDFDLTLAGLVEVHADDVAINTGANATGPILLFPSASITATASLLSGISVEVTNLRLDRDRVWRVDNITISLPSDFNEKVGVAGILPFRLSTVAIDFTNGAARDYTISVDGQFDFSVFGNLPFTPVISIGDLTSASQITEALIANPGLSFIDAANPGFSFDVRVTDGRFTLQNTGLIVLGLSDLDVGPATLTGLVALGKYVNGNFDASEFGGLLSLSGFQIGGSPGAFSLGVAGTLNAGVMTLDGSFTASFGIQNILEVSNATILFGMTLRGIGNGQGLSLDRLELQGLNIGAVDVIISDLLTFRGTNVSLDFGADVGESFATFGSLGVEFGEGIGALAGIGGTVGNFGLAFDSSGDIEFVTGPNFFVEISGLDALEDIGLPDWLPINITEVAIVWNNFQASPGDFAVVLDVELRPIFGLNLSGSVEGLTIDIGKLRDGEFPITNIDAFTVSIDTEIAGFGIGGTLRLATVDFDAAGMIVDGPDTSSVVRTEFYLAVIGQMDFLNKEIEIRFAISSAGPLNFFVSYNDTDLSPAGGILLVPQIGLRITGLRGGISFGLDFPDVDSPDDLNGPAFSPTSDLTEAEWFDRLELQLADITDPMDVNSNFFAQPIMFEVGATLNSFYIPILFFDVDMMLSITPNGNGNPTFGGILMSGTIRIQVDDFEQDIAETKLFFDISNPGQSETTPAAGTEELPAQSNGTLLTRVSFFTITNFLPPENGGEAPLSLQGSLVFSAYDETGNGETNTLEIVAYAGIFINLGPVRPSAEGRIALRFEQDRFVADFSMNIDLLPGILGNVEAVGHAEFEYGAGIWGAFELTLNNPPLFDRLGIEISAKVVLRFNTLGTARSLTLVNFFTGAQIPVTLESRSFLLALEGRITFGNLFALVGNAEISFRLTDVDGDGAINVGPNGNDTFELAVSFDAQLVIGKVDDVNEDPAFAFFSDGLFIINNDGIAGKFEAGIVTNFPDALGIELDAAFLIQFNTMGRLVTYETFNGTIKSVEAGPPGVAGVSAGAYFLAQAGAVSNLNNPAVLRVWVPALPGQQPKQGNPVLNLEGQFRIIVAANLFEMRGATTIRILGQQINLELAMGFYFGANAGVAAKFSASLELNIVVASLSGQFDFEFNTRSVATLGIAPRTLRMFIGGANDGASPILNVLGIKVYGSIEVEFAADRFLFAFSAEIDVWGVIRGGVMGSIEIFFDGRVRFDLETYVEFNFSLLGTGVDGHARIRIEGDEDGLRFSGSFGGRGRILYVTIASIEGEFTSNGILHVEGRVFGIRYQDTLVLPGATGTASASASLQVEGQAPNEAEFAESDGTVDVKVQFSRGAPSGLPWSFDIDLLHQTGSVPGDARIVGVVDPVSNASISTSLSNGHARFNVPAGRDFVIVRLRIMEDSLNERNQESLLLQLRKVVGAVDVPQPYLQVLINDNDLPSAEAPGGALVFYDFEEQNNTNTYQFNRQPDPDVTSPVTGSAFIVRRLSENRSGTILSGATTPVSASGEIGFAMGNGGWDGTVSTGINETASIGSILGQPGNWNNIEHFYEFTIAANSLQAIDIGWLEFDVRSSNGGPSGWEVYWSRDGYAAPVAEGTHNSWTFRQAYAEIDSTIGGNNRIGPDSITFRIRGVGAASEDGKLIVDNVAVVRPANIIISSPSTFVENESSRIIQIDNIRGGQDRIILGYRVTGITATSNSDFSITAPPQPQPFELQPVAFATFGGGSFQATHSNYNVAIAIGGVLEGELVLPTGQSKLTLVIHEDNLAEANETLSIELFFIQGVGSISPPQTITITNDDPFTPPDDTIVFFGFDDPNPNYRALATTYASGVDSGGPLPGAPPQMGLRTEGGSPVYSSIGTSVTPWGLGASATTWSVLGNQNYERSFTFTIAPSSSSSTLHLDEFSFADLGFGGPANWRLEVISNGTTEVFTGSTSDAFSTSDHLFQARNPQRVDLGGESYSGAVTFRLVGYGGFFASGRWTVDNVLVTGHVEQVFVVGEGALRDYGAFTFQTVVEGSTVYFDANANAAFDRESDPFAISDGNGHALLEIDDALFDALGGSGFVYATGGTDVVKGVEMEFVMRGLLGRGDEVIVLSPLTTLLGAFQQNGIETAIGTQQIQKALGLSSQPLTSQAYSAQLGDSNPNAPAALRGAAIIHTLIDTGGAAIAASAGTTDHWPATQVQDAMLGALASVVATVPEGGMLDFADPAVLRSVLDRAARSLGADFRSDLSQAVADLLAEGIALINGVSVSYDSTFAENVGRIQKVMQTQVKAAILQLAQGTITTGDLRRETSAGQLAQWIADTQVNPLPVGLVTLDAIGTTVRELGATAREIVTVFGSSEAALPASLDQPLFRFTISDPGFVVPLVSSTLSIVAFEGVNLPGAWSVRTSAGGEVAQIETAELSIVSANLGSNGAGTYEIFAINGQLPADGSALIDTITWTGLYGATVSLEAPVTTVTEADGRGKVTINIVAAQADPNLIVRYAVATESASKGADFIVGAGEGTFNRLVTQATFTGQLAMTTAIRSFDITILPDTIGEATESILVLLSVVEGDAIVGASRVRIQIEDDGDALAPQDTLFSFASENVIKSPALKDGLIAHAVDSATLRTAFTLEPQIGYELVYRGVEFAATGSWRIAYAESGGAEVTVGSGSASDEPIALDFALTTTGPVEFRIYGAGAPVRDFFVMGEAVSLLPGTPIGGFEGRVSERPAAQVFVDSNGNLTVDSGEAATRTDSYGDFSFNRGYASMLVSPASADAMFLRAPINADGVTVLSPLSTLLGALEEIGTTPDQGSALLREVFGLSDQIDIAGFDAYGALADGNPHAIAVLNASALIEGAVAGLASLLGDAGSAVFQQAALQSLAVNLLANGGSAGITLATALATIQDAATQAEVDLSETSPLFAAVALVASFETPDINAIRSQLPAGITGTDRDLTYLRSSTNGTTELVVELGRSEMTNGAFRFTIDPALGFVPSAVSTLIVDSYDGVAIGQAVPVIGADGTIELFGLASQGMVNRVAIVFKGEVTGESSIATTTIEGGESQRSMVRSITIPLGGRRGISDILLENADTGEAVDAVIAWYFYPGMQTLHITFPEMTGGSLPDGNYQLITVDVAGTATGSIEVFRLFGDANGDRDVDFADTFQFQRATNTLSGTDRYDPRFDHDADRDVDALDLFRFAQNFLTALPAPPVVAKLVAAPVVEDPEPLALAWSAVPWVVDLGFTYSLIHGDGDAEEVSPLGVFD
ncbi:MAG: LEPR-XLL domain-containing protein [Verrucomicrobiae bacterium]|nr:LEPR-XLL domain-containing protein [Verrucomicrobiae bacterium]